MTDTTEGQQKLVFPEHAWPLMRQALEHIEQHPDEFYMGAFVAYRNDADPDYMEFITDRTGYPFPACGTVACLAGHITLLADPDPGNAKPRGVGVDTALLALGINTTLDPIADALEDVFSLTDIRTYAELADVLESRFIFPEALPGREVPA